MRKLFYFLLLGVLFIGTPVFATNTYSLELNGTSQYAKNSSTGLNIGGAETFTLEAWFYSDNTTDQRMVVSDALTNNSVGEIMAIYQASGHIYCRTWASTGGFLTIDGGAISASTWYHVAFVKNADNDWDCYLDGTATTDTNTRNTAVTNAAGFVVGAAYEGSPGIYWDGFIDEVRLWSTARSSAEINAEMSEELVGNETGLVAYYKWNNNADDSQTSGTYDMTLFNSPTYSTNVPFTGDPPTPTSTPQFGTSSEVFAYFQSEYGRIFLWVLASFLVIGFLAGTKDVIISIRSYYKNL